MRTFKSPPFEVHEEGWGEFVRAPTFFLSFSFWLVHRPKKFASSKVAQNARVAEMARLVFVRQDIEIKVHFWPDSQLRPVTFNHQLKLYPNENAAAAQQVSKRPVVNEIYHELIFTAPEDLFVRPTSPWPTVAPRLLRPGRYTPAVLSSGCPNRKGAEGVAGLCRSVGSR